MIPTCTAAIHGSESPAVFARSEKSPAPMKQPTL